MAPKRQALFVEQPARSSPISGSESDSDSDINVGEVAPPMPLEVKRKLNQTKTLKLGVSDSKKKAKIDSSSSASSGTSDSDSNSESDSYTILVKLPVLKRLSPKPVSKPSKRPAVKKFEKGDSSQAGRAKGGRMETPSRLWAEGDAKIILQGMVDFQMKTGETANFYLRGYYNCLKGFLATDASKEQLRNKIRSLKRKYLNGSAMGEEAFRLSQQIWGVDGVSVGRGSGHGKSTAEPKPFESSVRCKKDHSDDLKVVIERDKLKINELNEALQHLTSMLSPR